MVGTRENGFTDPMDTCGRCVRGRADKLTDGEGYSKPQPKNSRKVDKWHVGERDAGLISGESKPPPTFLWVVLVQTCGWGLTALDLTARAPELPDQTA